MVAAGMLGREQEEQKIDRLAIMAVECDRLFESREQACDRLNCRQLDVRYGDAAAKAADVRLLEMRLANGLGGKSFVLISGDVPNVEAAMEAGVALVQAEGLLVRSVIIPQLHPDMRAKIA